MIEKKRSPCRNMGDINGDGFVTAEDAILIAQHIVGAITLNQKQLRRADVDGDGDVDIFDAMFISQYAYGVRTTLDACSLMPAEPPYPPAVIEVRDSLGDLLCILENASKISIEKNFSELNKLSFELPSDDDKLTHITRTNELWLYYFDNLVDCFCLTVGSSEGGFPKETIQAEQIASLMLDDIIDSYEVTLANEKKTSTILEELLAYQTGANPVTLGGVDASLDNFQALKISFDNIWSACIQLRNATGGMLYVQCDPMDPATRTLWLMLTVGEDKGQQIRTDKNLKRILREADYTDFCTKLYPIGKDSLVLSSALVVKETAVKSSDVTYGYLKLGGQYACYKGWTGAGDALPAGMVVYKTGYGWAKPGSYVDPDTVWINETWAYDGEKNSENGSIWWTPASTPGLDVGVWTSFVEFWQDAHNCTGLRVAYDCYGVEVDIDIFYTAAWHHLYEGDAVHWFLWHELTFAVQPVEAVRIRFRNVDYWDYATFRVYEVDFWRDGVDVDDSAAWKQGADERTLRCAIGDYDDEETYRITYFPTDYLYDWDSTKTVSKKKDFPKLDKRDMLIEQGRVSLTGLKEARISYQLEAIDLGHVEGRQFERLELGSKVNLIDEELDIDAEVHIIRILKPDLLQPELMEMEIANKARDLTDILIPLQ